MVQGVAVAVNGPFRRRAGRIAAAAILLSAALGAPVRAQDARAAAAGGPPLKFELNRLEQVGDECRPWLLIDNSKGQALKSLKVDLYAFDTEGVAQKRIGFELGPIQEKKILVRQFKFDGIACAKIGRILLNDLLTCEGVDASRESCLERIETTSRTSAELVR